MYILVHFSSSSFALAKLARAWKHGHPESEGDMYILVHFSSSSFALAKLAQAWKHGHPESEGDMYILSTILHL